MKTNQIKTRRKKKNEEKKRNSYERKKSEEKKYILEINEMKICVKKYKKYSGKWIVKNMKKNNQKKDS